MLDAAKSQLGNEAAGVTRQHGPLSMITCLDILCQTYGPHVGKSWLAGHRVSMNLHAIYDAGPTQQDGWLRIEVV